MSKPYSQIDGEYSLLPRLECQGKCQAACGPILMSRLEWVRIVEQVGFAPKAVTLTCPMLGRDGQCTVYSIRPMICRLWGLVEGLPCEWGCRPSKYLTDQEGRELLARMALFSRRDGDE